MKAENPAWHPVVHHIRADVEQGALLAKALGNFPTIFHEFYRSMVQVGETTGRLDESLSQLAVYLDKQAQLRAKIISALAYPALLVTVAMTGFGVFTCLGCAAIFWAFPGIWRIPSVVDADGSFISLRAYESMRLPL